jgi:hypothetical protein
MKIKTDKLIGKALDWVVAKCEGHDVVVLTTDEQEARWFEHVDADKLEKERESFARYIRATLRPIICVKGEDGYKRRPTHAEAPMLYGHGIPEFAYSTSWAQGGPIIDREGIYFSPLPNRGLRAHRFSAGEYRDIMDCWGGDSGDVPARLVVGLRCYVAFKLGDEVDVPDELLTASEVSSESAAPEPTLSPQRPRGG